MLRNTRMKKASYTVKSKTDGRSMPSKWAALFGSPTLIALLTLIVQPQNVGLTQPDSVSVLTKDIIEAAYYKEIAKVELDVVKYRNDKQDSLMRVADSL